MKVYALLSLASSANSSQDDTMDYLIQNVCVDNTGAIIGNGDPYGCAHSSRDLRPGEVLPYHKHDFLSGTIYQISDSFPVWHSDGSIRVIQGLDFDPSHAVSYIEFVPDTDGFNANQAATDFASIVGTADPSGGVQYFVASDGNGGCTTLDAWGLWKKDVFGSSGRSGSHVFYLNIIKNAPPSPGNCPQSYNPAFTTYELESGLKYDSGKTMDTLIQQHWAGTTAENSGSAEKEFFTKEYGLTRWEAWVKQSGQWNRVDYRDWSYIATDPTGGYQPYRFPVPDALIAGTNMLDNGDFGRGAASLGQWQCSEGSICQVMTESVGNHLLQVSGNSVFQGVKVPSWLSVGAPLSFGGQVWQQSNIVSKANQALQDLTSFDSKVGRGGCAASDIIYNAGDFANEAAVQSKCSELGNCAFYTWSNDPADAQGGAWFCSTDHFDTTSNAAEWPKWKVGRPRGGPTPSPPSPAPKPSPTPSPAGSARFTLDQFNAAGAVITSTDVKVTSEAGRPEFKGEAVLAANAQMLRWTFFPSGSSHWSIDNTWLARSPDGSPELALV